MQRILEVYRRAGRFAATVTPQYKVLPQNRADLIFVIDEGPTTGVQLDQLHRQRSLSRTTVLRREITTRQSRWWRFFEQADNYDPGQVEYDRSQLTRVLHQRRLCRFPRDLVGRRTDAEPAATST